MPAARAASLNLGVGKGGVAVIGMLIVRPQGQGGTYARLGSVAHLGALRGRTRQ